MTTTENPASHIPSSPLVGDTLESAITFMARTGACLSPSFDPGADHVAFVSNMSGIPQVWIVPAQGGWPIQVTGLNDQVGRVTWSPTGEWLAFTLAPGGGLNEQIYVVRPDGTGLRRLTSGGNENNWLGEWTSDGTALTIASNLRDPAAMDVYLVRVSDGTLHPVSQNHGVNEPNDVSRDRRRVVIDRTRHRGDNDLYVVDVEDGSEVCITHHQGPGSFGNGRFAPDGRTVYFFLDRDRELAALGCVRLDSAGQPSAITYLATRDDAELQAFELSEDGGTAVLVWNVAGRSELAFLELATLQTRQGPRLPMELVSAITWSRDGHKLAIAGSGSTILNDIWTLDRMDGRLVQLTQSPHPGVDLSTLVQPELVHFQAHDGLPLSGWLYRPHDRSLHSPIVLNFHGGPEAQERPVFNSTYQALLASGIAVFAPNVRGSSGFGKTFVNLDNGALRVNALRDIEACVNYVVQAGVAAASRVGIMGGSYGGYMTMAGLTLYPDLFTAGANLYGIVNFATFFAHSEPWMAAVSKVEYGDPDTQADMLRDLSPIHRIDRLRAPTLVLHGANDTNVPVVEAEQVVASLRERGIPVEYVLFPDEGHGFRKTANRIRATVAIVQFFTRYLGSG